MLNRRQTDVQFRNLALMCRITTKSLIDFACVNSHIDEDCEEFVNFCAVFEQMVSHRLRPYQKKVWHRGQGSPRQFWEVMLENHRHGPLFRSCIPNIAAIENLKGPKAKLRAFVRVALMEKRLSDYLQWLQNNHSLMEESFLDGALFPSEEGLELSGDIIGLSAIDFNFCLRGNDTELYGPLEINYVPFLLYTQSSASQLIDEEEMLQLSGKTLKDSSTLQEVTEESIRLANLEKDFKSVKEQKDYLEELIRLRERQMGESTLRVESMREQVIKKEKDWEKERKMMDVCVIELQIDLSAIRDQNALLKEQVAELQSFKSQLEFQDVPMVNLANLPTSKTDRQDQLEENADDRTQELSLQIPKKAIDQRSIQSGVSDQIRLKEDSQSLVPLTGSLADVNIAMLKSEEPTGDWKKSETPPATVIDNQGKPKMKAEPVNVELTTFEKSKISQEKSSILTATTNKTTDAVAKNLECDAKMSLSFGEPLSQSSPLPPLSSSDDASGLKVTKNLHENSGASGDKFEMKDGEEGIKKSGDESKAETVSENAEKVSDEVKQSLSNEIRRDHDVVNPQAALMADVLQDFEKAFENEVKENLVDGRLVRVPSQSNSESGSSTGLALKEDNNTNNSSSMSEPELVDKVNSSSDGSDVTWEMVDEENDNK